MAQLQSLRDAPGKSREYETVFILSPETTNDDVGKVNDRVKGIIENLGGSVLRVDNWGKRRLAYEVKKHLKGIYLYWQYLGTTGLVDEIERNLRMLDSVIRYMTIKIDQDIDPTARPSEMDDEAYQRAAETAADEEDIMTGAASVARDEDYESDDYESDDYGSGDYDASSDGDEDGDRSRGRGRDGDSDSESDDSDNKDED